MAPVSSAERLAVPVIAFSPMIGDWLGLPDVTGVQEATRAG